jgi:septal ring factor EnvC (AmiA/AmiB activator)
MNYKYKPSNKPEKRNKIHNSIKTRRDHLWTASIIFSFVALLYVINYGITGFVTYQENIESELNDVTSELAETKTELSKNIAEKETCLTDLATESSNLISCRSNLQKGQADIIECESSLSAANQQLDACRNDKESLELLLQERESSYNELLRNSVINTCCSVFDVRSGNTVSWSLENNKIVCDTGGNAINCTG